MSGTTRHLYPAMTQDKAGGSETRRRTRHIPSLRQVLHRMHQLLGISAGLVLAFMGVTGAMMVFEDEIMAALSPQARVEISAAGPLSPDRLRALIQQQMPQDRITALQIESDPSRAYTATVLRRPADGGRNPRIFVNPYDGTLLGEATGADFFGRVRSLHRYLTVSGGSNDIGRHITGIAAFSAIFFALSGIYLRWPRRPVEWRSWFLLDLKLEGRAFCRMLHSTIGSWIGVVYIISALSGLWWSYDWYRSGVTALLATETTPAKPRADRTAKAPAIKPASAEPPPPVEIDRAVAAIRELYGEKLSNMVVVMPQPGRPVRIRVLPTDADHDRALDDLQIDPETGTVTRQKLYADFEPGEWIMTNMDPIHTGILFGPAYRVLLLIAALGLPFFAATGLLLYIDRRRRLASVPTLPSSESMTVPGALIVYASQTGTAGTLAGLAAGDFHRAGIGARVISIADLDGTSLQSETTLLFVVSTYGEGHAPDSARRFEAGTMAASLDLTSVNYGILALGDRRHRDFCAFGERLETWLDNSGAVRLFDRLNVDAHDADTLGKWHQQLSRMGALAEDTEPHMRDFLPWRLEARDHLNPGSVGQPVFRLRLAPLATGVTWRAGDIAEIVAARFDTERPDDGPVRDYSIASITEDGAIVLVVRQIRQPNGELGRSSGWLTADARIGETIGLRIRTNANFHPPVESRPMILIGNGTGIAGLHAHLRHRERHLPSQNWLFFGERNQDADFLLRDELDALRANMVLQRISVAFSRDQAERIYVQHRLHDEASTLRQWVDAGAAIYLCGSSDTMAPAVDEALLAVLGADRMAALHDNDLYRRDIY